MRLPREWIDEFEDGERMALRPIRDGAFEVPPDDDRSDADFEIEEGDEEEEEPPPPPPEPHPAPAPAHGDVLPCVADPARAPCRAYPTFNPAFARMAHPVEFFDWFFDREVLDLILHATNVFIRSKHPGRGDLELGLRELRAFIGLLLLMGENRRPAYVDYWSTRPGLGDPFISNVLPRGRFIFLLGALHFEDDELAPDPEDPDRDRSARKPSPS